MIGGRLNLSLTRNEKVTVSSALAIIQRFLLVIRDFSILLSTLTGGPSSYNRSFRMLTAI